MKGITAEVWMERVHKTAQLLNVSDAAGLETTLKALMPPN